MCVYLLCKTCLWSQYVRSHVPFVIWASKWISDMVCGIRENNYILLIPSLYKHLTGTCVFLPKALLWFVSLLPWQPHHLTPMVCRKAARYGWKLANCYELQLASGLFIYLFPFTSNPDDKMLYSEPWAAPNGSRRNPLVCIRAIDLPTHAKGHTTTMFISPASCCVE